MSRLPKLAIILPAAILGMLVSSFLVREVSEHLQERRAPELLAASGSSLPQGTLIDLRNNHDEYKEVAKGKVLLVFLTTDCEACRKEIANVSQLLPSLDSKARIYGVFIEGREYVKPYVEENNIDFPVLLDHGARILKQLGFSLMPTKVLLENGIVTKIWYGSSPDKSRLLQDIGEVESK